MDACSNNGVDLDTITITDNFDVKQLQNLGYGQLQVLAKKFHVRANQKKAILVRKLKSAINQTNSELQQNSDNDLSHKCMEDAFRGLTMTDILAVDESNKPVLPESPEEKDFANDAGEHRADLNEVVPESSPETSPYFLTARHERRSRIFLGSKAVKVKKKISVKVNTDVFNFNDSPESESDLCELSFAKKKVESLSAAKMGPKAIPRVLTISCNKSCLETERATIFMPLNFDCGIHSAGSTLKDSQETPEQQKTVKISTNLCCTPDDEGERDGIISPLNFEHLLSINTGTKLKHFRQRSAENSSAKSHDTPDTAEQTPEWVGPEAMVSTKLTGLDEIGMSLARRKLKAEKSSAERSPMFYKEHQTPKRAVRTVRTRAIPTPETAEQTPEQLGAATPDPSQKQVNFLHNCNVNLVQQRLSLQRITKGSKKEKSGNKQTTITL